ncbi:hypothetical protein D3C80_1905380 [compost metagenome]
MRCVSDRFATRICRPKPACPAVLILFFRLFGKRVMVLHEVVQPFFQNMCIDLCRGNVRMTQQFLDGAKVGAVGKQVAGEGVAQHMRRDRRHADAGARGQRFQVAGKDLAW